MRDLSKRTAQLLVMVSVILATGLVGCTTTYPQALTDASAAIDAAKAAGKDRQCPDEFNAADKAKTDAYALCQPCDMTKAIAKANEALARAKALCPAKPVAVVEAPAPKPAPAPTPAPPPPPTVSLSSSPNSIQKGQCSTLTWSSSNTTSVTIDQGIGKVDSSGSKQVCPDKTAQYNIAVSGPSGSASGVTTVMVNKVVDQMTIHVNFDFNKATIRKADDSDLQKAIAFIKKFPGYKVSLVGYTDNIGSDKYNLKLSEKRAIAVKDYLEKHGVNGSKIQASGRGKADPIADNSTEKGRFENRRVEIMILAD